MRKPFAVHTRRIPLSPCPGCHTELNTCGGTGPHAEPGTPTICAYCNLYLVFTETLTLRLLTDGEWLALPPAYRAQLASLREFNKRQGLGRDKGGKR